MQRRRVLVLDEEIPFPMNTGKRLRTLNLLTHLSSEFEIDLLVHGNNADADGIAEIEERGIHVELAPSRIPRKSGIGFLLRVALNAFSRRPYSVVSHDRPGYRSRVRELVAQRNYDLIHVEWSPYGHYAHATKVPWIISAHNVESQIWSRMIEQERPGPRRFMIRQQARKMLRYEREIFARARWATAVSEEDAATLRGFGCRHVELVPNGVDTEYFVNDGSCIEEPGSLVFTGSMDWRPNQDAVVFFMEEILPRLLRQGQFRFYVVGRTPPAWLKAAAADRPEIILTGTVDDVRPYIARSALFVVPLRIGGGSRLKILEALAMHRAVVSTRVGAEGLDVEDGENIVLADDPEDFVRAIVQLSHDAARRHDLGNAGRNLVEVTYAWPRIASRQRALWREALSVSATGSADDNRPR